MLNYVVDNVMCTTNLDQTRRFSHVYISDTFPADENVTIIRESLPKMRDFIREAM